MNITGDDEPRTVHERIQMDVWEIVQLLARQQGKAEVDMWEEALSLHRVRYETEIVPAPDTHRWV